MHDHHHHHHHHSTGKRLSITVVLNQIITAAEVIGGVMSGSLALLSDAFHNLSDTTAILVSYFALKISRKPGNLKKTFGYRRAEIIAAVLNTVLLFLASFFIVKEGIARLITGESEIKTGLMLIVGVIGLFGNLFSVLLLHRHKDENLNIKAEPVLFVIIKNSFFTQMQRAL